MTRFPIALLGVLAMSCGLARAQLLLPGAVGSPPSSADFASSEAAVIGRPLRLDGNQGQLLLSSHGKLLRIDKFSLPGEVISTPSRKCMI